MPAPAPAVLAAALLERRREFKAFLVARTGNAADADDLLQHGLVKALRHAGDLADGDKAVAWFYRILRRALVDHARARGAARRRDDAWAAAAATEVPDAEAEKQICRCFAHLLPALKPRHAELLRLVELEDRPVAAAAAALGLTANHASVLLHRARAELRTQLVAFCGACAGTSCLDCDCG